MIYYVYILKSCVNKKYYIGCTGDIEKRIVAHNSGKTKSTKPYRPWELIHLENFSNKHEAYKREWYLKHPPGYLEKLKIINEKGGFA